MHEPQRHRGTEISRGHCSPYRCASVATWKRKLFRIAEGFTMKVTAGIVFGLLGLLSSAPTAAHHAFAVEFDAKACSDVNGVLTKVNYENPHAYVFLNVKNASGETEEATF